MDLYRSVPNVALPTASHFRDGMGNSVVADVVLLTFLAISMH